MTKRSAERETMLAEIATTAIEGGVQYWASVSEYKWYNQVIPNDSTMEPAPAGGDNAHAVIHDTENDDKDYIVTLDTVAHGLRKVIDGCNYAGDTLRTLAREADRTNEMPVNMDAAHADAIIQAGLFGEIVYG